MSAVKGQCNFCGSPATLRCSGCLLVAYCGKSHQAEDWSKHRKDCQAYKVITSTEGRYVVATRNIQEKEIIIFESPLVLAPYWYKAEPASCLGCFRIIDRATCSRCRRCGWPVCNEECRGLTDPVYHGAECKVLSAVKSSIISHTAESLSYLRCLVLQKSNPEKWKTLHEMAERADRKASSARKKCRALLFLEECILKPLASNSSHLIPDCSAKTVKEIACLVEAYGLPLMVPTVGMLVGVCSIASFFQQSCVPNTILHVDDPSLRNVGEQSFIHPTRVVVRATRNIRKGEVLTASFLHSPESIFTHRQDHIMNIKNNEICSCARCSDPTELGTHYSSHKCSVCKGWVVPTDPPRVSTKWKCSGSCGTVYSGLYIHEEGMLFASKIIKQISGTPGTPKALKTHELLKLLADLESRLHPHHYHCICVKREIIISYCRNGSGSWTLSAVSDTDLDRAAELCDELSTVVMKPHFCQPSNYDLIIFIHSCLQVKVEMMKRKVASGVWNSDRAESVKKECCELYSLANLIGFGTVPKQSQDSRFAQIKLALPLGKMYLWFQPDA